MEKLVVKGGTRLVGTVKTSGAKNAVLPIIAASILGTTPSVLDEVPMLEILAVQNLLEVASSRIIIYPDTDFINPWKRVHYNHIFFRFLNF